MDSPSTRDSPLPMADVKSASGGAGIIFRDTIKSNSTTVIGIDFQQQLNHSLVSHRVRNDIGSEFSFSRDRPYFSPAESKIGSAASDGSDDSAAAAEVTRKLRSDKKKRYKQNKKQRLNPTSDNPTHIAGGSGGGGVDDCATVADPVITRLRSVNQHITTTHRDAFRCSASPPLPPPAAPPAPQPLLSTTKDLHEKSPHCCMYQSCSNATGFCLNSTHFCR